VLPLDARLARGLADRAPETMREWGRVTAAARFFKAHAHWNAEPSPANLGIVSDFAGANEGLTHEILNLAERQHTAYRLIDKARPAPAALRGLRAALYADQQPPAPELRRLLLGFAEAGGLLVAGPAWGAVTGPLAPAEPHPRFELRQAGKGRIAVAKEKELDDPFLVASDAQALLSHRHDFVRFWNGGVLLARLSGEGPRRTVQLVNYTGEAPHNAVTMWVAGSFRTATLASFEMETPKKLEVLPHRGGVELRLPPFRVYAAIELG
jgi:hypothetical protein